MMGQVKPNWKLEKTDLMRKRESQLDLIRDGVCVSTFLDCLQSPCGSSSGNCTGDTKTVHDCGEMSRRGWSLPVLPEWITLYSKVGERLTEVEVSVVI